MKLKLSVTVLLACLTTVTSCALNTTTTPSVKPSSSVNSNQTSVIKPPVFDDKKLDGIKIALKSDQITIAGIISDSKTNLPVNKKVSISIEGNDRDKVENLNYSFDSGNIKFNLNKGIKPSSNNPVNITVVAHIEGYFSSSVTMKIKDEESSIFNLKMVDIKNTPDGITAKENSDYKVDNSGLLSDKINIALKDSKTGAGMNINIPGNTVLKDRSGNPLSGNIQTDIGYFNPTADSLSSFPGGLSTALVNNNGKQEDGYFITGGFTSIELTDDKGNKASTFSQPVEISMEIAKDTINPDTGKPIKLGDKIGIWSYDTQTGKWSSEGTGTIDSVTASGNFTVKYNVTHLSYWNLDWHYGPKCDPKLRLKWNGSPVPVQVEADFAGQYWKYPSILKDELNDLYNVPSDREITFVAKFANKEVGKTTVTLGDSCSEIGLNIDTTGLPQMREIPVYVGIKSKTEFTFDEIRTLADNFGITTEQKNIIFDYFKTNNITEPVKLSNQIINDLKNNGVQHLDELKALLEQKVRPDTWLYDYVADPYSYNYEEVKGGKASVRVFDGETHNLSVSFFYNDKYYWFSQDVKINSDTNEIILEKEDTDLTINIVKDYLKKMGLNVNSLKK